MVKTQTMNESPVTHPEMGALGLPAMTVMNVLQMTLLNILIFKVNVPMYAQVATTETLTLAHAHNVMSFAQNAMVEAHLNVHHVTALMGTS